MKSYLYRIFICLIFLSVGCSSSNQSVSNTNHADLSTNEVDSEVSKRILLNINEVVYFDFVKVDSSWSGDLTTFELNNEGEKVLNKRYYSANDSTWDDFNNFVEFLKISRLPPQNQIEGWVPDSGQLPQRVYNFEVYFGDTTRSYSYQDPINGLGDYWQSQNILTFVTFIQNELHWLREE